LDLIVCVLAAVVMDTDDPCRFGARQLGAKFRMGDDDVFGGIRARQHPCDIAPILSYAEHQDYSDED
jgi:hypothetical protein